MRFFVASILAMTGVVSARQFGIYEPIATESSGRSVYFKPTLAAYEAAASANAAQVSAMLKRDHGPWTGSEMNAAASEEIMDGGYGSSYGMAGAEMMGSAGYGYGGDMGGYADMGGYGGILKGKEIVMTPKHKPITLHYRTHAQPIVIHQTRIPGPKPEVKHTMSHEEPHRVVHEVVRPIIQEVHEIIQPYRRVVQQVQPVVEEIQTLIAKDAGHSGGGGYGMGGGGGGMGHIGMSHGGMSHGGMGGMGGVAGGSIGGELGGEYAAGSSLNKQFYRRALPSAPMSVAQSQIYEQKVERPRTFVNKRGVPVYHSNYGGAATAQY